MNNFMKFRISQPLANCNNNNAIRLFLHLFFFRPSFVSIFDNSTTPITKSRIKQNLRRTPSEPLRVSADLFRGSHIRCDIPFYTADGIELLGFQRLGTIHLPRIRSGSDPSCSLG